jgi:uncharacterized protein
VRAVVKELYVHPLKSAGGTRVTSAEVTPTGFRHDREFMLVDPGGAHLSQRELPRMALLRPSFDGRTLRVDSLDAVTPLAHEAYADGPVRDLTLFGKPCQGVDQGDEAAGWFSALLDFDCRLVRFAGRREASGGGGTVMYADGHPFLVLSAESVADLNSRLDDALPMTRFRPNIVIEGFGAFGEDSVDLLRVGDTRIEIDIVGPCRRCVIITTDQETGARSPEPLRTLAGYRTRRTGDGRRGVIFGQKGIPRTLGTIRAGDRVCAESRHTPP